MLSESKYMTTEALFQMPSKGFNNRGEDGKGEAAGKYGNVFWFSLAFLLALQTCTN